MKSIFRTESFRSWAAARAMPAALSAGLSAEVSGALLTMLVTGLAALLPAAQVQAQEWSARQPVKLVIGYPPGGSADAMARELVPGLSKALGQTVVVDYRPGASGAIGAEVVAKSAPDGYTIGLLDNSPMTIQGNFRKLPFDPLTSFTPITGVGKQPFVLLVNPQLPVRNLDELIRMARARPGALTFSSSGQGSMHHISGEMFKSMTKTHIVHIPYRGAAPALVDLMGGQVQMSFATIVPSVPYVQSRQLRPLAVTSERRTALLPDVPTLDELGLKGFNSQGWFAVFGPANLPPAITEKLVQAFKTVFDDPALMNRPSFRGAELMIGSPAQLQATVRTEAEVIARLVKTQGIRAD